MNILREICCYISDVQKLTAVLEKEVKCFDVATSQWERLLALRKKVDVDHCTASAFIAPSKVLVCGGGAPPCTSHVDRSAYMLEGDGSVQKLQQMSTGRCHPGLAWDSARHALYVFAGFDGSYGTCYTALLRTSEKFQCNKWSPLPNMHKNRCSFNPCWHLCLVYLCGGRGTYSVETYDPRSNIFDLKDFSLPEIGEATAVVECGVLTVISWEHICKVQQGRLTSVKHEGYNPWSSCTPLVSGGMVYLVKLDENCCRSVDLATGAKVQEVDF